MIKLEQCKLCGPGWVQCQWCGRGRPYVKDECFDGDVDGLPRIGGVVKCSGDRCEAHVVFLGTYEDGRTQGWKDRRGWVWLTLAMPQSLIDALRAAAVRTRLAPGPTDPIGEELVGTKMHVSRCGTFRCHRCSTVRRCIGRPELHSVLECALCGGRLVFAGDAVDYNDGDWAWHELRREAAKMQKAEAPVPQTEGKDEDPYYTVAWEDNHRIRASAPAEYGSMSRDRATWARFDTKELALSWIEVTIAKLAVEPEGERRRLGRPDFPDPVAFESYVIIRHTARRKAGA